MLNILLFIGYIKLRVEKKVFELSAILDTYNVSIYVTVTERLGIISFKDVNFILSVLETETTSEVGKPGIMCWEELLLL